MISHSRLELDRHRQHGNLIVWIHEKHSALVVVVVALDRISISHLAFLHIIYYMKIDENSRPFSLSLHHIAVVSADEMFSHSLDDDLVSVPRYCRRS